MKYSIGLALVAGTALAADWTWNPQDSLWLGSPNWNDGVEWTGGTGDTATFGASSEATVDVNGDVTLSKMTVNDDYAFTNGTITLNGDFIVADGKTATVESALRQTDTGTSGTRLRKYGRGTLELKGGTNEFYRFSIHQGTVHFNGGEHRITGTSTAPNETAVTTSFAGGNVLVDNGAVFTLVDSQMYSANSGADIVVSNATFDASKATEFLNGFADNNAAVSSTRSSVTIETNGVFAAQKFRISKRGASGGANYGVLNVNRGGVLRARVLSMDANPSSYYGEVNFDGGTWDAVTNGMPATDASINRIGGNSDAEATKWSHVDVKIKEGGLYLRQGPKNSWFFKGFSSGAEHDGGVHFYGTGAVLYWFQNNSYNGGNYLEGGGFIFAAGDDPCFGVVPPVTTNNIFFNKGMTLHVGKNAVFAPTRGMLLASNITATLGTQNNCTARFRGPITASGTNGVLQISSGWTGWTELAPAEGVTNHLNKLRVNGRLRIGSGVTLVEQNCGANIDAACPLFVEGDNKAFSDTKGNLTITGGVLKATKFCYTIMKSYGQLNVLGGVFDVTATQEWINGLGGIGRTTVAGTGEIIANAVRISQAGTRDAETGLPLNSVNVNTGGVLRLNRFYIDTNYEASRGCLNLNGGTVISRGNNEDFLGTTNGKWTNVLVRVCEGGAIFDTTNFNVTVRNSVFSGAPVDGGFTKKGTGTLTLANTNTWNGATRVDDGQLVFSHADGYPGGDLAFTASALARVGAKPLITVKSLPFREGAKIRILDAEDLDSASYGKPKTVLTSESEIESVPSVVLVQKDGTEAPPKEWKAMLSDDGKSLLIGPSRGTVFIFR